MKLFWGAAVDEEKTSDSRSADAVLVGAAAGAAETAAAVDVGGAAVLTALGIGTWTQINTSFVILT